ncbi:MAG: TonB family protein [Pyrinomonadaceae bacterium]
MNRNQRIVGSILVTALVLASAIVIFSQQKQPAEGTVVFQREKTIQAQEPSPVQRPRDDTFYYVTSEMSFDGKLVKGAPYSAQAVTEMTQTLSDGNRIVSKSSVSLYRDSEGRTRREQTLRAIGPFATASEPPTTIFINDPVAHTAYMLDARTHIARKMPTVRLNYMDAGQAVRARVPRPPEGAAPMPPPGVEGKVEVESSIVMSAPAPGPEGGAVFEFRRNDARKAKHESLGKQTIEGVEADGTRETVTIPAGEVGNELPIEIVSERWYSRELQTVVMTKHSDPRFGETVYRLTNIDRSEPAKALFEVPADYTVKAPPTGIGSGAGVGAGSGIRSENGTTIVGAIPAPQAIDGGVLNGKATSLPLPQYSPVARQAGASGAVTVQITIDEEGNVIAAQAISGHPLLRAAAVSAAREAKFSPTRLVGQPVKVQGVLIYNFGGE